MSNKPYGGNKGRSIFTEFKENKRGGGTCMLYVVQIKTLKNKNLHMKQKKKQWNYVRWYIKATSSLLIFDIMVNFKNCNFFEKKKSI